MKAILFSLVISVALFQFAYSLKCYDVNFRVLHCPVREEYTFVCLAARISRGDDSRGVLNCYPGNCEDYRQSVQQAGLNLDSCRVCDADLCNADESEAEQWNEEYRRSNNY